MRKSLKIILLVFIVSFSTYKIIKKYSSKKSATIEVKVKVDYIRCKSFRRRSKTSTIKIKYLKKDYNVLVPEDVCEKLELGKKIILFYSKETDKVFYK